MLYVIYKWWDFICVLNYLYLIHLSLHLSWCGIRSRDNTASADVQHCAAALRSTAAASAPLCRFHSTVVASAPLRPFSAVLRPLYVGVQLCSEYVPQWSALMGHHSLALPDRPFMARQAMKIISRLKSHLISLFQRNSASLWSYFSRLAEGER